MTNRIVKENGNYTLITENGNTYPCTRWYEKKTDSWHVKISKEGAEECGRTYVRESRFADTDTYTFETKTEHRTGLSGGGWRSKMTPEEAQKVKEAEETIERIKALCMTRETPKVDPNSEEGLMAQMAKIQARLAKLRGEA